MKIESKYTMKDLPENERPTEKLVNHGAMSLSNSELIAVIIRTGSRDHSVIELANQLLSTREDGIASLADSSIEEIIRVKGIGNCKAAQILAAVELGKRIVLSEAKNKKKITSPLDIVDFFMADMQYLKREHFKIVMLDTKNHIIGVEEISVGNLNSSIVHPREVYKQAIKRSSASIILVHNHPSGDPTPSKEDINITRRLMESGEILGIRVLDHIVIGHKNI
ncbi:DNA repair protein RadC [Gottschalkia acidurici 9a]|uniref:DNA repair protein RadC n=1 Tax=Gottschalkia acidurici (strain ATCC 7906 / DSM 604 / BCRC 14475 / CIP 104303 / KCTC 5404 / NCIMB 10678 / 9a) TaxID=1128398 RepID=K0AZ96_GOTA9|nr:DNA repair protein RadC [Gottschalkia acidurici]AFS78020.1 DNA repair protein RadC [Gottschalkia acidurici 9a]